MATKPAVLIGKVFGVAPARLAGPLSNQTVAEWDSFGHISLIAEIESEYGISLSVEEALRMTDLEAIERVLLGRGVRW